MGVHRFDAVAVVVAMALGVACGKPGTDVAYDAPQDACYLGMSLPAGFTAFAADSPWRTPIATSPEVDANSAAMIQGLKTRLSDLGYESFALRIAHDRYTIPTHIVDAAACAKVDVRSTSQLPISLDANQDNIAEDIPLPRNVWPDPSDDSHLMLLDPKKRIAWEFWNFTWQADGSALVGMAGKWDLDGPGYNVPGSSESWWRNGATGPKTPYIGGLIRYDEFAAGHINHALNVITPYNRLRVSDAVAWTFEFCSPVASRTDGRNVGPDTIPEGVRLQLNPDLDLDALGLSANTQVIARALQEYGAYVMDSGAGFAIKAQNLGADGGAWNNYRDIDLSSIPIEEFRVLSCSILHD